MSKMKKVLFMCTAYVLVAALAIGGTLAYLTDRDSEVNTFTVGDVAIDLIENFEQGSELIPGKKITKEVSIKNIGNNDAWVWYTYAVPTALINTGENASLNAIHFNIPGRYWDNYRNNQKYWEDGQTEAVDFENTWHWEKMDVDALEKDGVKYTVVSVLYNGTLSPGEITNIGLEQIYLDTHIDIAPNGDWYWIKDGGDAVKLDWNTETNGVPMIYVSAYAIQADEFEKVQEAYAAYNKQWGENGSEYAPIEKVPSKIEINPENIDSIDFSQDNAVFKFSGTFTDDLTINVQNGLNQTFDATDATFANNSTVTINAPGIAHAYNSLNAQRSGIVTIKNFVAETLNVLAYNNEEVNIVNNTVNAISVIGGNFALNIENNVVDGNFGTYKDGENQTNDYGISLRITDYELSIKDNTITNTYSHAIGINGRQGEVASDWGNCGANNKITVFTNNNITVNTTGKTKRAALKIWCDQVYAPYATSGNQPNAAATKLMDDIVNDTTNVITLGDTHTTFNIFDYTK